MTFRTQSMSIPRPDEIPRKSDVFSRSVVSGPSISWPLLIGPASGWRVYLRTALIVLCAAMSNETLKLIMPSGRPNLLYLLSIIISAHLYGARAAYLASALAFVSYNYFDLNPRFSVTLSSFEDYFSLAGYLAVGAVTAHMAGRIKAQSDLSLRHAETAQSLFEASREMSATDDEAAIFSGLVRHLGASAGAAVVLSDKKEWRTFPEDAPTPTAVLNRLRESAAGGNAIGGGDIDGGDTDGGDRGWVLAPLGREDRYVGVAAWRKPRDAQTAEAVGRVNRVLIEVAAAAVARSRLSDVRAEMQTRAQSNRLRDALVSSISHDLRTPLTAILTSATSLRNYGDRFSDEVRTDLAQTIAEEAERLDRIVTNILSITKIEADALSVELRLTPLCDVARAAIARSGVRSSAIRMRLPDDPLMIDADPILLDQAIVNVLQNAVRYSPPSSCIEVEVWREGDKARMSVADHGPGVPADEYARIFEKFYRSPGTANTVSGSGLGLSIVQGLVQSQKGSVWAGPRADGASGLVIDMSFPVSGDERA